MNRLQQATRACLSLLILAGCLSGCVTQPPTSVDAAPPAQWYAPLPHDGKLTDLTQWWQQQGDPLLVELITAAEAVSPTVAAAQSRLEQARASRAEAVASFLPTLDASVSATRANGQPLALPTGTTVRRSLTTSWETDLFGGARTYWRGTIARHEGAQAGWHDARVSVAAETANQYYEQRACEQLARITRADADSRAETARLSELSAKAGFTAPATAALARAAAAEGNGRAVQQQAQCDLGVKALVALTAINETDLRKKFAAHPITSTAPSADATIAIDSLPANILAQRPDVFAADAEVAAASADVGAARAQRYPRLRLLGSIGRTRFMSNDLNFANDTWSFGPLSISLPLFDGGKRTAQIDAAQARYEEAVAQYRAKVRQAVREVEEALVNLHSTALRSIDAQTAVDGYRASFAGTESRYQTGLASLVELEESRRTRLAAETAQVTLQRERQAAWVALYRAAGGGWSRPTSDVVGLRQHEHNNDGQDKHD
ncbi:MAG: efflux transporter outer membrane subunit [Proteobacteria bacterium]|nr:efflux transporter outer membrane subunit [Pseudomonadota bacterium]